MMGTDSYRYLPDCKFHACNDSYVSRTVFGDSSFSLLKAMQLLAIVNYVLAVLDFTPQVKRRLEMNYIVELTLCNLRFRRWLVSLQNLFLREVLHNLAFRNLLFRYY